MPNAKKTVHVRVCLASGSCAYHNHIVFKRVSWYIVKQERRGLEAGYHDRLEMKVHPKSLVSSNSVSTPKSRPSRLGRSQSIPPPYPLKHSPAAAQDGSPQHRYARSSPLGSEILHPCRRPCICQTLSVSAPSFLLSHALSWDRYCS